LTQLGTGEALVTMLNEKGVPTPLVHCMVRPPQSRMDVLKPAEIDALVSNSKIALKYNVVVDNVSAYEMLSEKLDDAARRDTAEKQQEQETKQQTKPRKTVEDKTILDNPIVKSMTRTAGNTLVRTLLGVLGLGGRSRKSIF
jgi:hypothetical protein